MLPALLLDEDDELLTLLAAEDETLEADEEEIAEELLEELTGGTTTTGTELLEDEAAELETDDEDTLEAADEDELLAVRSAQKPGEVTLAPAASVPFQDMEDSVTVLPLCVQLAFHSWVILPLGRLKLPLQLLTAAAPGLRMVI